MARPFFDRNGLLYLKTEELQSLSDQLVAAQPLLGTLAADPSLRGLFNALGLALEGVQRGEAELADLDKPLGAVADATEAGGARERPSPSRGTLCSPRQGADDGRSCAASSWCGRCSTTAISSRAARRATRSAAPRRIWGFTPDQGARVRLTGSVALSDEEFASVAQGAGLATALSFVLVCVILFIALRSLRLIAAILVTLVVGLIWSAAFAAATVGALNLLSVAFAVLFVGIAVDFGGIQFFCVRYRDERYRCRRFYPSAAPHCASGSVAR